jgi:hypothetical protein
MIIQTIRIIEVIALIIRTDNTSTILFYSIQLTILVVEF